MRLTRRSVSCCRGRRADDAASVIDGQAVLLATRNDDKVRELRPLFAAVALRVETLTECGIIESVAEDELESFDTFEGNALAKARWFARLAPGRVVCADDSGLEVDALDARPGVRSKRWSGRTNLRGRSLDAANNDALLAALVRAASQGRTERTARYVCAAACVWSGGEFVTRGLCDGVILQSARGEGGFGYDPLFLSRELGASFGEVSDEAKRHVSHRSRAFALLLRHVSEVGPFAVKFAVGG